MPAKVLKLDMSFLVDARHDNDAGKIVAAIINMAHALQKEVVAEGIERVDQLKLLKRPGLRARAGLPVRQAGHGRPYRPDLPRRDRIALDDCLRPTPKRRAWTVDGQALQAGVA
jgi:predicted signal transduction protein with EAL and GGDEF domain